jgi:hypothetical protein
MLLRLQRQLLLGGQWQQQIQMRRPCLLLQSRSPPSWPLHSGHPAAQLQLLLLRQLLLHKLMPYHGHVPLLQFQVGLLRRWRLEYVLLLLVRHRMVQRSSCDIVQWVLVGHGVM